MSSAVTIYTIHASEGSARGALGVLPHRFSRAGFVFGPFWLAAQGLWPHALVLGAVDAAILTVAGLRVLDPAAGVAILALLALLVGLDGREWARRKLERRGAALVGLGFGASEAEALGWAAAASRPSGSPAEVQP